MFSFDEMVAYCLYENNVGPILDMDDVDASYGLPVKGPAKVDTSTAATDSTRPSDADADAEGDAGNGRSFTDLPFEIRLQIYHWIHRMSPVRHAQLAPWYPTPVHCQYIVRRVDPDADPDADPEVVEPGDESTPATPGLLSPYRPLSGLPTGLLQCSSQIYHETRGIPFAHNEFVFVNWFASGLWAARAFTRALEAWQRAAMRFVRLEMLARDLAPGAAGHEEWLALCSHWGEGVRGLRVKMVLGGNGSGAMAWGAAAAAAQELDRRGDADPAGTAREARGRVAEGLRRMRRLERVEMELVTRRLEDADKVRWCEELEEELRGVEGLGEVRVVCTEKTQEKMEWIRKEVEMKHLEAMAAY